MTNNWEIKTRGINEEYKPISDSKGIDEKFNVEKKARESFSNVMLGSYKDLGHYIMAIEEHTPMSDDSNKRLEMKLKESQEVFSSMTVTSYKDLGRYGMTIDK